MTDCDMSRRVLRSAAQPAIDADRDPDHLHLARAPVHIDGIHDRVGRLESHAISLVEEPLHRGVIVHALPGPGDPHQEPRQKPDQKTQRDDGEQDVPPLELKRTDMHVCPSLDLFLR